MSLGPLYVLLGEMSIQVLCPFLNWIVCLPGVKSYEFFIYFGDKIFVWCVIGKYVLPFSGLSFHVVDGLLCHECICYRSCELGLWHLQLKES